MQLLMVPKLEDISIILHYFLIYYILLIVSWYNNIDFCSLGHESIAAIMTSRLKNLSVVARYWGDGDIKVSTTSLY